MENLRRDLKVRVSADCHAQLLSLKILRGKNMAACVMEALDFYLANRGADGHVRPEGRAP